jgi:hypothetical protein
MRWGVNFFVFAALLAAASVASASGGAHAAVYDGSWSVLIVTEKGDCDAAYRYAVKVAGGKVQYAGDSGFDLGGTVDANGTVKVSIRRGDRGAAGSGKLLAQSGSGIWHGIGGNGACAGHWEAERR